MDEIVIEKNKDSERLRFAIEMKMMTAQIKRVTAKPSTLEKFERLIQDNEWALRNHLPDKLTVLGKLFSDTDVDVSLYAVTDDSRMMEECFDEYSQTDTVHTAESAGHQYDDHSRDAISMSEKNTLFSEKPNKADDRRFDEEEVDAEKSDGDEEEEPRSGRDDEAVQADKDRAGAKAARDMEIVAGLLLPMAASSDVDRSARSSEIEEFDYNYVRLTAVEALGVAAVLDKGLDQLDVLDSIDKVYNVTEDPEYTPFAVRMRRDLHKDPFYLTDTCKRNDRVLDRIGPEKLQKERLLLLKILRRLSQELKASRTFTCLHRINYSMLRSIKDEKALEHEWSYNKQKLAKLLKRKSEQQKIFEDETAELTTKELMAADKWEKALFLIEAEQRYIQTWEDQWMADNKEMLWKEKNNLLEQLQELRDKEEIEKNGADEARSFLANYTELLNRETQMWENRYDTEVSLLDIQLLDLVQVVEDTDDMIKQMTEYNERLQKSINEFEQRKLMRQNRLLPKPEKPLEDSSKIMTSQDMVENADVEEQEQVPSVN